MKYVAARSLNEAVGAVEKGAVVLAGGTDLLVGWERKSHPASVCDIGGVPGLRGIEERGDSVWVGALTTHAEVAASPFLGACAAVLREAAASVGAVQIRNRGTVGGNVVNASPAGDVLTALYVLEATVELVGPEGQRNVPIESFVLGPRRTDLRKGELVTGFWFRKPGPEVQGYTKLGLRSAQAIAVVSLAARLALNEGVVTHAVFALGSVAPTPVRARKAEGVLLGKRVEGSTVREVADELSAAARPIDDVRASAEYRRAMAGVLFELFVERQGLLERTR